MMQYLIILLDDTSVSYCHYENNRRERKLIPIETLKQGIRFGMMENLMIQYVYPDYELPNEYVEVIESIDHSKIKPVAEEADVLVVSEPVVEPVDVPVVLRLGKTRLFDAENDICEMLTKTPRLNVVITDIDSFTNEDFERYRVLLEKLSKCVEQLYAEGRAPQLNLLTDRIMLSQMNNCGSGVTNITLAPNGKFYVCPAFYYDNEYDNIGDLEQGVDIKNNQLYLLNHAPICCHCDSYQCKRCIWLNRKTTLEVNTPSHEQCVLAHLERNMSRELLCNLQNCYTYFPEHKKIKEIDYLDPFEKKDDWQ